MSQSTIGPGQSATLSWSSTNATACFGNNFATSNATSGAQSVSPSSSTTYGLSCNGVGGTTSGTTTATLQVATFSFTATTIAQGQSTSLTWNVPNASSCTGTNFTPGSISGSQNLSPSYTTTYSISCPITGGGTATASQKVTVTCTPSYTCTGAGNNTITYTDNNCNISTITTCTSPQFCSPNSSICLSPNPVFNTNGNLTGHLQIRPQLTPSESPVTLYWNVSNVLSCTVSGSNGDHFSGTASNTNNNGTTTSPITGQTSYTLSCKELPSGATSFSETQWVNIVPGYQEK